MLCYILSPGVRFDIVVESGRRVVAEREIKASKRARQARDDISRQQHWAREEWMPEFADQCGVRLISENSGCESGNGSAVSVHVS